MYTTARITKVDVNGVVYLDLRREKDMIGIVPKFDQDTQFDGVMAVRGGDCVRFRGGRTGKWSLSVGNYSGYDDFYWTYAPNQVRPPRLTFTVKRLSTNGFRLNWKGSNVSRLKVQVVNVRTGKIVRTAMVTSKSKGSRTTKVYRSKVKRLRVTFMGPAGKETRRVALPRRR